MIVKTGLRLALIVAVGATIGCDRVRVYRTSTGSGHVVADPDDEGVEQENADLRDYDVEYYERLLRDIFASRLARALTPADFAAVFAGPDQLPLFPQSLAAMHTVLTTSRPQGTDQ
jgi:DNA polymerase I